MGECEDEQVDVDLQVTFAHGVRERGGVGDDARARATRGQGPREGKGHARARARAESWMARVTVKGSAARAAGRA
jgi:hypothetical protein